MSDSRPAKTIYEECVEAASRTTEGATFEQRLHEAVFNALRHANVPGWSLDGDESEPYQFVDHMSDPGTDIGTGEARITEFAEAVTFAILEELDGEQPPEPAERPKDGDPYVGPEPILLGIGKIRVAICSDTDDPKHVARELVIYDDGEGPKPVGTPEPEHAGKRADQVGKVLARLRVVNAKGAMIFASDLMTVIENAARADYGSSETKEPKHE